MNNGIAPDRSMGQITAGMLTKSEKIRALATAGYGRSDIARFLGIRYQHVRNVLVRAEEKAQEPYVSAPTREWVQVGSDGRVVIPTAYRTMLGVERGGPVLLTVENSELRVTSREAVVRGVQAAFAPYFAGKNSPVDELLAERRAEAERESKS